jgi:two-component system, OmpR family, KDP operon response regulator KdpE
VSDARVLVVDDDRSLLRALDIGLRARGYDVAVARDGESGVSAVALAQPDLVVLDMSLPDLDGVEVCGRIRSFSDVPILVLSALGDESRKVQALDCGADDYVTKPFSMGELEARVRVLLRRSRATPEATEAIVHVGPLAVDAVHKTATLDGVALGLTAKEFDLLSYLARHVGKVCTQQMVLREVWGRSYSSEANYLRVYAHRIRRKLGPHGSMFVTHPGIGYELVAPATDSTAGAAR